MRLKFPLEIISIHAPREGGDRAHAQRGTAQTRFQSTPPARGATPSWEAETATWEFQSTPPARGATWTTILTTKCQQISIHAPREGGDLLDPHLIHLRSYFNPRPPRGGRLPSASDTQTDGTFQSTPPARGATISKADYSKKYAISIHAPREGGDKAGKLAGRMNRNFNPRPPRGGRPAMRLLAKYLDTFQSTPPARGATPPVPPPLPAALDFNPRPPRGGRRPDGFTGFRINRNFNPRPPRGGRRPRS